MAAGLAETGRLGAGPVWCWLTRVELEACGLPFAAYRPPLGRVDVRLQVRHGDREVEINAFAR